MRAPLIVDKASRAASKLSGLTRRALWHRRPFTTSGSQRLLILGLTERIPQSQIAPFHHYAPLLRDRFGAEVREVPAAGHASSRLVEAATVIAFQTEFSIPQPDLLSLVSGLRDRNPKARLVYLDWFAPTDLRLAERMMPLVDLYVKKHLLRDRLAYGRETLGDTNLVDHYSRRFNLPETPVRFAVPDGFFDKLLIGPSFLTADFMLRPFQGRLPPEGPRPIDLHARLAVAGTGWYSHMRGECVAAMEPLRDLALRTGTGIGHMAYLRELEQTKICFSPFGYGEVCWRDFEAVLKGAVLLKPDMSHIETDPDIFRPWETYAPLRWDMTDLEPVVRSLLADAPQRRRLAETAFGLLQDYARSGRFADQMARLFG